MRMGSQRILIPRRLILQSLFYSFGPENRTSFSRQARTGYTFILTLNEAHSSVRGFTNKRRIELAESEYSRTVEELRAKDQLNLVEVVASQAKRDMLSFSIAFSLTSRYLTRGIHVDDSLYKILCVLSSAGPQVPQRSLSPRFCPCYEQLALFING